MTQMQIPSVWEETRLALSSETCCYCQGEGIVGRYERRKPCNCVYSRAFKVVLGRWRSIEALGGAGSPTCDGMNWSRKALEFCADFHIVSRRTLSPQQWKLFELYHLKGNDWRAVCKHFRTDRTAFFREIWGIELLLGRVFGELQPYGLFPVWKYFKGAAAPTPLPSGRVC